MHCRLCGNRAERMADPATRLDRKIATANGSRCTQEPNTRRSPGRLSITRRAVRPRSGGRALCFSSGQISLSRLARGRVLANGPGGAGVTRWISISPAVRPTIASSVAMSGGVDSSVAAAFWSSALRGRLASRCSLRPCAARGQGWRAARGRTSPTPAGRRASRHCALRSRLREPVQAGIIGRFAASYRRGETRSLRRCISGSSFASFSPPARSRRLALATGHYVRCIMARRDRAARLAMRQRDQSFSCSRRHAPSLTICASAWADLRRGKPPNWRGVSGFPSPTSRTARYLFVPRGSYVKS